MEIKYFTSNCIHDNELKKPNYRFLIIIIHSTSNVIDFLSFKFKSLGFVNN